MIRKVVREESSVAPGMSPLVLDFLNRDAKATPYLPNLSQDAESRRELWEKRAAIQTDRNLLTKTLLAQNRALGAGPGTLERIPHLFSENSVAVLTGQQAGILGGPLLGIYKALSALATAKSIEEESGLPAVAIFWVASHDSDLEEIRSLLVSGGDQRGAVQWELPPDSVGRPAGDIVLGDSIEEVVEKALTFVGGGPFEDIVRKALDTDYIPGHTPATAFGKFLIRWLGPLGLSVFDPMGEGSAKALKAPLVTVAGQLSALRDRFLEDSEALPGAGYHRQIKPDSDRTGLFRFQNGRRVPIFFSDSGYKAGEETWTPEQLVKAVEEEPGGFAPGVRLRSICQDLLFPTAAYVGGPAEVSYMAQLGGGYETLSMPKPNILLRDSFTLLSRPVARLLERYSIEPTEVFQSEEDLAKRCASERLSGAGQDGLARLSALSEDLTSRLRGVRDLLEELDPSLSKATETAQKKMLYQVEKLESRLLGAARDADRIAAGHAGRLAEELYPDGTPQERVVSFLAYLIIQGPDLFRMLLDQIEPFQAAHRFIFLEGSPES